MFWTHLRLRYTRDVTSDWDILFTPRLKYITHATNKSHPYTCVVNFTCFDTSMIIFNVLPSISNINRRHSVEGAEGGIGTTHASWDRSHGSVPHLPQK